MLPPPPKGRPRGGSGAIPCSLPSEAPPRRPSDPRRGWACSPFKNKIKIFHKTWADPLTPPLGKERYPPGILSHSRPNNPAPAQTAKHFIHPHQLRVINAFTDQSLENSHRCRIDCLSIFCLDILPVRSDRTPERAPRVQLFNRSLL